MIAKQSIDRLKIIGGEAMSTTATTHHSYLSAQDIIARKVPGAFVECGVYAGSQCGAMALAIQESGESRTIHCFDSFRGFPKASAKDSTEWQDRLGVGSSQEPSNPLDPRWGFDVTQTVSVVQERFRRWGFPLSMFVFHEGWFCDTVPKFNEPIAILRIDGDLYESTKVCIEHLYAQLAAGGICIIDDYPIEGCRKACDEYFQGSITPVAVDSGGGPVWWVK